MRETIAKLLIRAGMKVDKRFHPSQDPPEWFLKSFGVKTQAGVDVTDSSAMTFTAVFSAIRILAETLATLPLIIYKRGPGNSKERDTSHPLYRLLHNQPNPEMTAVNFFECMMAWLGLRGNAYAEIERNGDGSVRALWPIPASRVCPERDKATKKIRYVIDLPGGGRTVLLQEEVLHIRGLSLDGIVGLSPIAYARETIGLGLAAQEFGARLFSNNSVLGGLVEHPGKFKDQDTLNRLKNQIEEHHRGLTKAHRILFLEEGMKWHQTAVAPEDAQFLETRKFQVAEVARIYRMPLTLLQENDKAATYASVEQFMLSFIVHTMRPWLVRWEQGIWSSLFFEDEKGTHYAEFLVDGLLRGDITSRYAAYSTGIINGFLSPDEVRSFENLNPRPDGKGGEFLRPMNMQGVDDKPVDKKPAPPAPPPSDGKEGEE